MSNPHDLQDTINRLLLAVLAVGPAAAEPAAFRAIDAVIRLEGPTITVHDDQITIEGLRVEHPARLTVHAGPRQLNLRHNAFLGGPSAGLDVCRDETCHCHQTKELRPMAEYPDHPRIAQKLLEQRGDINRLTEERDNAYRERAHLVALLAAMTGDAVIAPATDVDEPHWHIVYLTIGGKQASWHVSPRDTDLFQHVPLVPATDPRAQWDGHSTDQKYGHIARHVTELAQHCGPACAEQHTETGRCEIARNR